MILYFWALTLVVLKYGYSGDKWGCMNEYFDKKEIAEKFSAKYKVHPLPRVKMKLITGNKMELHVSYTMTEICTEIIV